MNLNYYYLAIWISAGGLIVLGLFLGLGVDDNEKCERACIAEGWGNGHCYYISPKTEDPCRAAWGQTILPVSAIPEPVRWRIAHGRICRDLQDLANQTDVIRFCCCQGGGKG